MVTTYEPPIASADTLEDRIRERAHELWLLRDNEPGSELEDWLHAEREIIAEDKEDLQE